MRVLRGLAMVWAAAAAAQQSDLPPHLLLLARIKVKMAENLERLPNYTCIQTVERSLRKAGSGKFQLLDTLRLEVALVSGKELYSWPGAGKFEDRELSDIVGGGTSGTGAFGLHLRAVFQTSAPTFSYAGEELRDGRRAERFEYRVSVMLAHYRIRMGTQEGVAGYHGSFWVDAETLDLMRLELYAEDIPPHVPLSAASDSVEYARVRIGEGDFLLPARSELTMTDLRGNESRNRTSFTACRQYTGESAISFADPPPDAPSVSKAPVEYRLPRGTSLRVKLERDIRSGRFATGDPVEATVAQEVKTADGTVIPKGAVLSGRVTRMERRTVLEGFWIVGLEFHTLEFANRRADFRGDLVEVSSALLRAQVPVGGNRPAYFGAGRPVNLWPPLAPRPGEGLFVVRGGVAILSRGLSMTWRTEP